MGWLSKKLKKAKRKLKKLKLRDVVKGVTEVADALGKVLPSPLDKAAELVEGGLKTATKKYDKTKKVLRETKSAIKTGDPKAHKKRARYQRKLGRYMERIDKYNTKADLNANINPKKANRYSNRASKYGLKVQKLEQILGGLS